MIVYIFTDLDYPFFTCKYDPLGLQRLQGRKPPDNACSCIVEKMRTFSFFGSLDLHEGRQKTPVDFTAYMKISSYDVLILCNRLRLFVSQLVDLFYRS